VLPEAVLERIVRTAFPHGRVVEVEPLLDGFRNANFKLRLDTAPGLFVLRIYEHDVSLCQKEIDLLHLVAGSVPVPALIHAEPRRSEDIPPFALMRFVEGISFRDLRRSGDMEAIAQAAFSAGETLACIGRTTFGKPGWLAPGLRVTKPLLDGADPMPRFVDSCLATENLQQRMPADLRDRTHDLLWSWAASLAALGEEARLVHGDFNGRNLLVRPAAGRWAVSAVLDWEFAVSGAPLADLGNFLRYERADRPIAEPHFSTGYLRAGGALPQDWRRLAKLIDLTAVCESLTHEELPGDVTRELLEIVRATVESRDPQFV
jgi:aminoglycoside phosphotransferase (APT) family kinase protein